MVMQNFIKIRVLEKQKVGIRLLDNGKKWKWKDSILLTVEMFFTENWWPTGKFQRWVDVIDLYCTIRITVIK